MGAMEGMPGMEAVHKSFLRSQPLLGTITFFFPQEKVIPSVVIEPASNNEGEEHEAAEVAETKETPMAAASASEPPELAAEPRAGEDSQPVPSAPAASQLSQEVPPGFLYKVWWPVVLPLL